MEAFAMSQCKQIPSQSTHTNNHNVEFWENAPWKIEKQWIPLNLRPIHRRSRADRGHFAPPERKTSAQNRSFGRQVGRQVGHLSNPLRSC
jgi:hypothetical protein